MKRNILRASASVFLFVCGLIAVCGGYLAAPSTAEAAPAGEIKVAYIGPLTGDAAQYGLDMQKAVELKVKQVNEAGGVKGQLVRLDVYDDKNDPKEAINIANRIVDQGDVIAVFGPFSSTCAMVMTPIFQREEIIHYAITASHPDVTSEGEWIFRGVRTQKTETAEFADFMYNDLEKRSAAVLYINNDFGASVYEVFNEEFTKMGGKILSSESYIEGQTKDFSPMLTNIKAAGPDVLFVVAFYNDFATILNQAANLDLNCDIVGPTAIVRPEIAELAGENAEGVLALSGFVLDAPREVFQDFRTIYKEEYGQEVNSFVMNAYDGISLVLEAIEAVGPDKHKVRERMANLKDYEGLAGVWGFDENRNPSKPLFRMKIENGKWVVVSK